MQLRTEVSQNMHRLLPLFSILMLYCVNLCAVRRDQSVSPDCRSLNAGLANVEVPDSVLSDIIGTVFTPDELSILIGETVVSKSYMGARMGYRT